MSDQTDTREARLNEVIADFLAREEAGHAVDPDSLVAEHPDLAADLRSFFDNRAGFARLAADVAPAQPSTVTNRPVGDTGDTAEWNAARRPADPGLVPDGYEVLGELGRGGMGVVYKVRDKALGREAALKMILAGRHASDVELVRFLGEARAAAAIAHPNVVQVYAVDVFAGLPYFTLELCRGGSLAGRLNESPLPAAEAARLVTVIARAVQHAHDNGIVHRDLKPANILLASADGDSNSALRTPRSTLIPKVADFGLAKQFDSGLEFTATGAVMGTPSYMAPELAAGGAKTAGPAADVYALGAILYECLTGRPPFRGATRQETLDQVRHNEPVAPRRFNRACRATSKRSR